jgi:hypothetical protein
MICHPPCSHPPRHRPRCGRDREADDMTLPADVARCIGTDLPECTTCRRRTDPPHERQVWTGPWELEGVPCEMRIPSDSLPRHANHA